MPRLSLSRRGVGEHGAKAAAHHGGLAILQVGRRGRHHPDHHGDGGQRQQGDEPEQAGQAQGMGDEGPVTMAMAKVMPKLTPMKAMALVRFCSRVRSESSAMTAAEMAPLPCRARPTMTPDGVAQGGDDAARPQTSAGRRR